MWCWDFVFDRTRDGRMLKWLTLVDEYSRECLALEVGRRFTSRDVLDVLARLFVTRGQPKHLRSDNGPEFIAQELRGLARPHGNGSAVHRTRLSVGERL